MIPIYLCSIYVAHSAAYYELFNLIDLIHVSNNIIYESHLQWHKLNVNVQCISIFMNLSISINILSIIVYLFINILCSSLSNFVMETEEKFYMYKVIKIIKKKKRS